MQLFAAFYFMGNYLKYFFSVLIQEWYYQHAAPENAFDR